MAGYQTFWFLIGKKWSSNSKHSDSQALSKVKKSEKIHFYCIFVRKNKQKYYLFMQKKLLCKISSFYEKKKKDTGED